MLTHPHMKKDLWQRRIQVNDTNEYFDIKEPLREAVKNKINNFSGVENFCSNILVGVHNNKIILGGRPQ
jgi:hypothetical protein